MRHFYKEFCGVIGLKVTEKDAEIDALFFQPLFKLFNNIDNFSNMLDDHFTPERKQVRDNIDKSFETKLNTIFLELLVKALKEGNIDLLKKFDAANIDFTAEVPKQGAAVTIALKNNKWEGVCFILSTLAVADIKKLAAADLDIIKKNRDPISAAAKKLGFDHIRAYF